MSGQLAVDERQQAGDVDRLPDDLEARRGKRGRKGLAEEDGVVGEDDPDRRVGRAQGDWRRARRGRLAGGR